MKLPRQFFQPLAIGAPAPMRDLPVRLERMIHFVPPHVEKMRAKVPEIAKQVDVEWGQLQLEQSTWAMHSRVEKIAASTLQMRVPPSARVRLISSEPQSVANSVPPQPVPAKP